MYHDLNNTLYQAILTCGGSSERNLWMDSGLANMRDYFFTTKNNRNGFRDKMASYDLVSDMPLRVRPGLSQGGRISHREAGPLTGRQVLNREAWPLTERKGRSDGGRASYREAGPLTVRLGLSQGGRTYHREAGPLTGRPGLSQGG